MITKIYFETFASGMRARLDPAYRQVSGTKGRRNNAGTPKREIRDNRNAFMTLKNVRKVY